MDRPRLNLASDGLDLDPRATAQLLERLTRDGSVIPDSYGLGGTVAAFEARLAAALGKERAIVMPTGTLANLLALDLLADRRARRIVVQADGHIMNDVGDAAARRAGLTLVPLQDRGAGYSAAALDQAVAHAASGRVAQPIAAAVIETPVRRRLAQMVDMADFDAVVAAARRHGLRLHLDAARLFIAAAWSGRGVAALCAPFDTVYVSLYKQLGTPFGAALAGPAALIDGLHHERRGWGGGLAQMWPAAVIADHFLDGMAERWARIAAMAPEVWQALAASGRFTVERIQNGSNIAKITPTGDADGFARRAEAMAIRLPEKAGAAWPIRANETWLQTTAAEIAARLVSAAG